ncbi:MAG: tRNA pseudouridine(55) synthase TruB [Steroidobacteraceae bacterium]
MNPDRPRPMRSGILLLDKPVGLSSNGALQRVRRLLGGIKAGHTGSLDPLASGMLPICIGEATKLAGEMLAGDKTYAFRLQLGRRTATGDAEGAEIERCPVPALQAAGIEAALARFRGEIRQVPPMYSALKRDGEPLYRLARRGETVERAPRTLAIHHLEQLAHGEDWIELRVACSKGTYVRVLGEDIAAALGSCGHLASLRREHVEPFGGRPMLTLEALEERLAARPARARTGCCRPMPPFPGCRPCAWTRPRRRPCGTARASRRRRDASAGPVRLYGPDGAFMGLGEPGAPFRLKVRRLFAAES